MADDPKPFYAQDLGPRAPRTPTPGFRLWEVRNGDRVIVCELRDDSRFAAGVDVQLIENGEILFSQRCVTADDARFIAASFKKRSLMDRMGRNVSQPHSVTRSPP